MKNEKTFGSTVLNKVLYYIDNTAFLQFGKPISELEYIKQEYGPTPDPKTFLPLREKIIINGALAFTNRKHFGKDQIVPINLVEPKIGVFETYELNVIDGVIEEFLFVNGRGATDKSHEELAWVLANKGDKLPFFTYLQSAEMPTENDINWAMSKLNV